PARNVLDRITNGLIDFACNCGDQSMGNSNLRRSLTRKVVPFVLLTQIAALCLAQAKKSGSPEENPPRNIIQLTAFGERAVWSPDGKRIAFMSKSFGDAFEIDVKTRLIRLLTGRFHHEGFLRVHYLSNGDFFLI